MPLLNWHPVKDVLLPWASAFLMWCQTHQSPDEDEAVIEYDRMNKTNLWKARQMKREVCD